MALFKQKMHWKKYIRELANRGSLTLYTRDDLASKGTSNEGAAAGRGRPVVFPYQVIVSGLFLQQVYRLPLRQTVGLMRTALILCGAVPPGARSVHRNPPAHASEPSSLGERGSTQYY
jgi:hypothetical protein